MTLPVDAELSRLVEIMRRLRAEGGCPWDREQDLRSLRPYLVEETFEVLDEMDKIGTGGSWKALCEELGDLLFQIVFHSQLATELGEFTMADVCRAISDKIESRHPHVFGTTQVTGATQVLSNWAKLKAEERKKKTGHEGSVLDGVPRAAPALLRAERLTEKASRLGFDFETVEQVRAKLNEELDELDEAIAQGERDHLEHELGDVLFCLANLARFLKTPAEDALRQANVRFTRRFHHVEEGLRARKVPFGEASLDDMNALWNEAKKKEHLLPPPRHTCLAQLHALKLKVRHAEGIRPFFETLAPWVGWNIVESSDSAIAFHVDAHGLLLHVAECGMSPVVPMEIDLDAPSREAVDSLLGQLTARNVPILQAPKNLRQGYSMTFLDPENNQWSYVFRALAG